MESLTHSLDAMMERDDTNKWIEWATRITNNFERDDDDCEAVMKIKTPMNINWKKEKT